MISTCDDTCQPLFKWYCNGQMIAQGPFMYWLEIPEEFQGECAFHCFIEHTKQSPRTKSILEISTQQNASAENQQLQKSMQLYVKNNTSSNILKSSVKSPSKNKDKENLVKPIQPCVENGGKKTCYKM